ncbi:hypothetical protein M2137_002878 [Parabacteroides sp. PFB2-10]|nr:hypothetical protein [Parabacteroides sp. PFB2-10]
MTFNPEVTAPLLLLIFRLCNIGRRKEKGEGEKGVRDIPIWENVKVSR